ncbi:MAG TPA: 50S ribosomal protein L3 N(5)-glutamine methyltransferase [Steroidobacteraceae bacterium]|nr:50S ribosomal protein L3 N(5)-glutamine methyltransferase [Steroidobacteraceae bacterium]
MSKVSHKQRLVTVAQLIERGARRLQRARVFFGHGTDNAWDESAALIWHALKLPPPSARSYARSATLRQQGQARALITRRIDERMPAVYLTGTIWFAGLKFKTDARALIPRSPIAELIERGYAPWIDARRVRRVLDIGTGNGCIAIATAKILTRARVDAVDVSAQALGLAAENVRHHRLGRRVRLLESDYFGALTDERYDIIVSNPPYVGARELRSLPAEYRHEPRMALASGKDGMDAVRVILKGAGRHLNPGGILIVEVGNTEAAVRRAFARLPFTWLTFERGGGGVFMLTAEQLGTQG